MDEETLGRGPKGGRKEELGEEEWVSLNTLSLRKTKIWQDYSTSLELKRGEEMGVFVCFGMNERGCIYSSGKGNMNGRSFNEGWQRIINLDLILAFGKSGALNVEIDESEEQAKFGFPVAVVTACRANFEKSYLTQFWSELSRSCSQIEAPDV